MSDQESQPPHDPKKTLSEISHLFLSSIRDKQTNGTPRPLRTPPGQQPPPQSAQPSAPQPPQQQQASAPKQSSRQSSQSSQQPPRTYISIDLTPE